MKKYALSRKNMKIIIRIFFILFLFLINFNFIFSDTKIKVGIYQNPPKVFGDSKGIPRGFFVDVTNEIAKQNNFEIEYVFGTWTENMNKLENREIDCLLDISYSDSRAKKFLFNKTFVIESWIQVFALENKKIDEIKDLSHKKIAVIASSTQEKYAKEDLRKEFNLNYTIISYKNYHEMIEAVLSGEADLLLGDRFFYYSPDRPKEISPKSVIIKPSGIYYAFRNDFDVNIIKKFENSIFKMKSSGDSIYYKSLANWLREDTRTKIPYYFKIFGVIIVLILLITILSLWVVLLWNKKLKLEIEKQTDKIKESEEFKNKIFESSDIPMVIMDSRSHVFLDCNIAAVKKYGYGSKKDTLGKTPLNVSFPLQYDGIKSSEKIGFYVKEVSEKGLVTFEWKHQRPNNEIWYGEVHLVKFPHKNKKLLYFFVIDITERKVAEKKLKRSKQDAEKANRVKSDFLSNMNHELRTPMNGIIGFCDYLRGIETDKEKMDCLNAISFSAENLMGIINDVLSSSKLEAYKVKIYKKEVKLSDFVNNNFKIFKEQAKHQGLDFFIEYDNKLPEIIYADKSALQQILNNLMSNSLKFTEQGSIKLSFRKKVGVINNGTDEEKVLKNYLELTLSDTGIGINEKKQKRLYEPFEQGEHYLTKKYGGTGLGLSIVKRLTDLMEGEIIVNTKINEGTKIIVKLPLEEFESEK